MESILSIVDSVLVIGLFLLVFGILVFVHELGHFLAARATGTRVVEFAVGFGPQIIGWKGKNTKWVLRLIPFGGYCQIEGQEEDKNTPDSYSTKNYFQKLLILLGGVTMNYILAVMVFYIIVGGLSDFAAVFPKISDTKFAFGTQSSIDIITPKIEKVIEDSPAAKANIKPGGTIKFINSKEIYTADQVIEILQGAKGESVDIEISYEDGGVNDQVEKYTLENGGDGRIGVQLEKQSTFIVRYNGLERVFVGFAHSINYLQFQVEGIASLVSESQSSGSITPVARNVSGPFGIFKVVAAFFSVAGLLGVLNLIGLLSLALAFFNILPFPALDGGHIAIITVEKIIGRKISQQLQNYISLGGFIFLILIMILVTFKDLIQFGVIG